jgi:Beta propeller domain
MLGRRGLLALSVSVSALVVGAGGVQLLPGGAPVAHATGLTAYSDCAALLAHYRSDVAATATAFGFGYAGGDMRPFAATSRVPASSVAGSSVAGSSVAGSSVAGATRDASAPGAVGTGATGTNLQEQGVDEPDLAKLRDGRLVVLAHNALQVLSADDQPLLIGSLRIGGSQANDGPSYGGELLLVGDRALVVVPGYRADPEPQDGPSPGTSKRLMRPYFAGTPTTRLVLVDLSSDQPRLLEEATYDGQYVSARLVGGTVRLVTTSSPRLLAVQPSRNGAAAERDALVANQNTAAALELSDVLPQVVRTDPDGRVLQRGNAVSCGQTTHARTARGASTLLVTTMQPAHGLGATDSTAVTTDGDLVYASQSRLYVATSHWGTVGPVGPLEDTMLRGPRATGAVTTEIHSFDTSSATTTRYVATGSVPGFVLGRWALSEYEGTLRVATTGEPPWEGENVGQSSSMLVKLVERAGSLVETGRVEGLGKTEQIRAVRYFGDVAAVVTFRQTDPLYLVDLSGTPKVLGELKVPGFSTYLHPIGDGKLLGLGQDTDKNGQVSGLALAVFDISDLSSPSLVDRLSLGSGYSPALDDSRAFGYDPQRRLAVFPFASYDQAGGSVEVPSAIGVHVDSDGRLHEVGRTPGDRANPPSRVLQDGVRVYVVGESGVVAASATTMARTGTLDFP